MKRGHVTPLSPPQPTHRIRFTNRELESFTEPIRRLGINGELDRCYQAYCARYEALAAGRIVDGTHIEGALLVLDGVPGRPGIHGNGAFGDTDRIPGFRVFSVASPEEG